MFLGTVLPKQGAAVYDCAGKADLSKGRWKPKRILGVTTHFSEIIKNNNSKNALKYMRGYLQCSFWIAIAFAKICFSRVIGINRAKNILGCAERMRSKRRRHRP